MMDGKKKLLALGVAAGGLAVTLATPAHTQQAARPFYLYQGKRIELDLAPDELVVGYFQGVDATERRSLALSSGPVDITLHRLADSAWRLRLGERPAPLVRRKAYEGAVAAPPKPGAAVSKVSPAVAREAALARQREAFQALRDDPSVEWVYQALRNPQTGRLVFPTPRIVVQVRDSVSEDALRQSLPGNVTLLQRLPGTAGQYVLRLTDPKRDDPLAVSVSLSEASSVIQWAEPDFIQQWRPLDVPNDALFGDQWHLRNTGQGTPPGIAGADSRVHQAWDQATGNGSVVIAVIDDGVQLSHPDLAGRIFVNSSEIPGNLMDDDLNGFIDDVNGWDFFQSDNDANPILTSPSHGTAVAGVAAAQGNNLLGGSGSCRNCRILPVRIADDTTFAGDATIATAITYAGTFADVLNNSWGGGSLSMAITSAIQNVTTNGRGGRGAPTLFATGNSASGYIPLTITGFPAGTYTFEWAFFKDSTVTAGLDSTWLDNIIYPDGSVETFEGCSGLPAGWTTSGSATWTAVNGETRASSSRGGNCAIKAGSIAHSQISTVQVTKTFATGGNLRFSTWISAETNSADGTGPIVGDNGTGPPECFDGLFFSVTSPAPPVTIFFICGTYSNQGLPLEDGTISYPASLAEVISVGAATNFDRRSDYSQWGPSLDFVAHSSGGSLGITTTDVTGANGYSTTDYTASFGGTSSATPHAAGIVGLLLSARPATTAADVRTALRAATRKIGPVSYVSGRNDNYGFGALDASALDLDLIFADGVDAGNTAAWTATQADGGDLAVAGGPAALSGPFGMSLLADDTNSLFVQDDSPTDDPRYRARFLINPNNFDPGEATGKLRTRIFLALDVTPTSRRAVAIVLRRAGGVYSIMGRVRRDDGTLADTGFFTIAPGTHSVQFDWRRATAAGANNGTFSMWIDEGLVSSLTGIDNDTFGVDAGRLGLLSVKAGTGTSLFLDDFESRRVNFISP